MPRYCAVVGQHDTNKNSVLISGTYIPVFRKVNYWKYVWEDFVQPILTSNGIMGGSSFACDQSGYYSADTELPQYAYYCFDGACYSGSQEWQVNDVSTSSYYWISWYNPNPIKISSILVTNAQGTYVCSHYYLQGSDDNSNWINLTEGTNTNSTAYSSWTITIPESSQNSFKYHRIYTQPASTTSIMIGAIDITATVKTSIESSFRDYDYKTTNLTYASLTTRIRKYYKTKYWKYVWEDFVQPVLTSNGTIGGTSFAVSASSELDTPRKAYCAFDGVTANNDEAGCWHSAQGLPAWLQFYNPIPLNVSKLTIINRSAAGAYTNSYGIAYSDDGSTFTEFTTGTSPSQIASGSFNVVINEGSHKYWRINVYSASGDNNTYVAIGELNITATYKTGEGIEATSDDYDYTTEVEGTADDYDRYEDII